jgi:hypothetical protein
MRAGCCGVLCVRCEVELPETRNDEQRSAVSPVGSAGLESATTVAHESTLFVHGRVPTERRDSLVRRRFDSGASPETPDWRKDLVPTPCDMSFKCAGRYK